MKGGSANLECLNDAKHLIREWSSGKGLKAGFLIEDWRGNEKAFNPKASVRDIDDYF